MKKYIYICIVERNLLVICFLLESLHVIRELLKFIEKLAI